MELHAEGLTCFMNLDTVVHGMLLIISTFYGVTIFTTRLTQCASMIRDVAAGVLIVKEAGGLVYDP